MARPVLIDTDAGVDDALALILALRSPEISVKAITTVAGNVEVGKCTRNVFTILDELQTPDPPPVAQGAARPLRRPVFTAPEVHGSDGLGDMRGRKAKSRRPNPHAWKVIRDCCLQYSGRLTIVALGPLTNLATVLRKDPRALRSVKRIVSMGGAFRVPGNTGPVAEFNYFVDPDAADALLGSGVRMTVVPLDVTERVVLMRKELELRARRRANRASRFILGFTKKYMRFHDRTEGFYGAYLHDPIAVTVAVLPAIVETRRTAVRVETKGELTRGMSVAVGGLKSSAGHPLVDVATDLDGETFLRFFHSRLWK